MVPYLRADGTPDPDLPYHFVHRINPAYREYYERFPQEKAADDARMAWGRETCDGPSARRDRIFNELLGCGIEPWPASVLASEIAPDPADKPDTAKAGRPSADRQQDIVTALLAGGTPLTRSELQKAIRLKREGALGRNLSWMVKNDLLINIPRRGYWPKGRDIPV
jgi:hypothetical protein